MALNFPSSPVDGQTFSSGATTWTYDATSGKWIPDTYSSSGGGGGDTLIIEQDVTGLSLWDVTLPTTYNRFRFDIIDLSIGQTNTSPYISVRTVNGGQPISNFTGYNVEYNELGTSGTGAASYNDSTSSYWRIGENGSYWRNITARMILDSGVKTQASAVWYGGNTGYSDQWGLVGAAYIYVGTYPDLTVIEELRFNFVTATNSGIIRVYGS